MKESVTELSFAEGKIAALPKGMKRPPELALAAARLAWKTGFSRFEKLIPGNSNELRLGDAWELFGAYRRLVSYVTSPSPENAKDELRSPPLAALRKSAAKQVSKKFLRFISKLEGKFHCSIPAPTQAQLIEHASRSQMGVENAVTEDGEPAGMKTKMARIYYLLWFFWPQIEHGFTAPEIHDWLAKEHGEGPSDKLVEKILTDLRKDARGHQ